MTTLLTLASLCVTDSVEHGHDSEGNEMHATPQTTISAGPNPVTTSRTATLTFASDEAGSAFECSLDGAAWAACS